MLRDQVYLKVQVCRGAGVLEGVPVRKSGIRIGEVMAIAFDERPNQPDGVIVTLALERRYPVREGSVPRLTRSLIGDVAIDMEPGKGTDFIKAGRHPNDLDVPIIEGEVAPDPSKALAAATKAFEKAGDTLASINEAANGLAKLTKSADNLDRLLTTWNGTGQDVSGAAQNIKRFIANNQDNFHDVVQKVNTTLDPETQKALKDGINKLSSAAGRIDAGLADLDPAFKDLGSKVSHTPTTEIGYAVRRLNVALADLGLLTSKLRSPQGGLNTDGSLQKLLVQSDLHDNLNRMAVSANQAFGRLNKMLATLQQFAEKVASDPSILGRGAFSR